MIIPMHKMREDRRMKQLLPAGMILLGTASANTRNFCNGDVTLGTFTAPAGKSVRATVRVSDPRVEWSGKVTAMVTSQTSRTRIAYSLFSKTNHRPLTVNDILDSTTIRCG